MDKHEKQWHLKASYPKLQSKLSKELNISTIVAQVLINNDIKDTDTAHEFFNPDISKLADPFSIAGITEACRRIVRAASNKEKILIYGDYDADGLTATALMCETLTEAGLSVEYLIPNRLEDGYGLNDEMVEVIIQKKCSLMITVDCGVTSIDEINKLSHAGIDVIITDHHQPGKELPSAVSIVNPKISSCPKTYDLAGVGVAFKLLQALVGKLFDEDSLYAKLDLVALGTVADIVPLTGDNRILVKEGLKVLKDAKRMGLAALIDISGCQISKLSTRELGYGLAPRINAAGRIGSSDIALELLLTSSKQRADEIAKILNKTNKERQLIEEQIVAEAKKMLEEKRELLEGKIIVLASELWHSGVAGIVASKLMREYYKPVIIIAIEGEVGKGSARSIDGCNIYQGIKSCKDLLLEWGGHEQAAGITINKNNIDNFRHVINKWATDNLDEDIFIPKVLIDAEILLTELNLNLAEEINMLAPFGHGNLSPLFLCRNTAIVHSRKVGKNEKHLKMTLDSGVKKIDAIAFNLGDYNGMLTVESKHDLVFYIEKNTWQGREEVQLNIQDIKSSKDKNIKSAKNASNFLQHKNHKNIELDRIFIGNSQEVINNINYFLEQSIANKPVFIVTETNSISLRLYEFYKGYLQYLGINSFCVCQSHDEEEIKQELTKNYNLVFVSYLWWSKNKNKLKQKEQITYFLGSKQQAEDCVIINEEEFKKIFLIDAGGYGLTRKNKDINKIKVGLEQNINYESLLAKTAVIWVANEEKVLETLKILEQKISIDRISYWHGNMSYVKQQEMVEKFNEGVTTVMLTTLALPRWLLCDVNYQYFSDIPCDKLNLDFIMLKSGENIFFNEKAFLQQKSIIEANYPTRKSLTLVYSLARNNGKRLFEIPSGQVINFLNKKGMSSSKKTYKKIINVFFELGLTGHIDDKEVSLEESWRYNESLKQHEKCQELLMQFEEILTYN